MQVSNVVSNRNDENLQHTLGRLRLSRGVAALSRGLAARSLGLAARSLGMCVVFLLFRVLAGVISGDSKTDILGLDAVPVAS